MTFDWKQALGSVALSAMALSIIGTNGAVAQNKPDPVKPSPTAAKIEQGQLLDKGPRRPPTVERGIKDNGVKSGVTTEAARPAVDEGNGPGDGPSAEIGECGPKHNEPCQILDKGPRWNPSVAAQEATPPATGDGTPPSTDIEQGQMLDKGPRWKPSATERRAHSGPGGTPPSAAKGSNTGLILGITAGAAALAAVLASGNNNDNPTSP